MKKLFHIPVIGILILFFIQTVFAGFVDVLPSNENYDAIIYAQENGIVKGYADGTFKTTFHLNRAEFTKIVVKAILAYDPEQDTSGYDVYSLSGLSFHDLKSGEWYVPYIRKAFQKGIISGYPDLTFKPGSEISFVEAAKIIVKSFGYQTQSDPIWYKPFVKKLAELKAIPLSITSFDYKITRGEMVEIIYRLKEKIVDKASLNENLKSNIAGLSGANGGTAGLPMVSSTCSVFPADNPWNRDVSHDPLDSNSDNYIQNILSQGGNQFLHADFGGNGQYGIPYTIVSGDQAKVPINIVDYPEESDPGPYPIPADAKTEGGSDSHALIVDKDNCKLYELYQAQNKGSSWDAASAAIFDLTSNNLRPEGWTSADAAGLPIFAGLARYDEVNAGAMNHALRFTVQKSQKAYIHPATHYASSTTDSNFPPMGLHLRLKADFDISSYTGESRVILETLKKYGMILADNGSNWYITGAMDPGWDDDDLNQLKKVPGGAFEVVKSGELVK